MSLTPKLVPALPHHVGASRSNPFKRSWNCITADILDAKRSFFIWEIARGVLPLSRAFTGATLVSRCSVSMMWKASQRAFHDCLIPADLIERIKDEFMLPEIPYPNARYLSPSWGKILTSLLLLLLRLYFRSRRCDVLRCIEKAQGATLGRAVFALISAFIWDGNFD